MRSGNPVLREKRFVAAPAGAAVMTLNGTVDKTAILLGSVIAAAAFTWSTGEAGLPIVYAGAIVGLILGITTAFKPVWAPRTAPLYAIAEGAFLGGISGLAERAYPGIVIQAVILTFAIMIAMLLIYRSGLIRVTENFRLGVVAATGGIALFYLASFILGSFGIPVGYLHSGSGLGILISLGIIVIASLNLVLDFDFIEHGVQQQAPKYMEWYGAFGLLVTLIWLYIEVLRLLARLRR